MASSVIGALRVNLGLDTAAFQDGMRDTQSRVKKLGTTLKVGLAAAGFAAGAAIGSIAKSIQATVNSADDMSKAAAKIGIPIEELSRLKYAADLSDVSFEGLQTSVGRLSRLMNDAATSSKSAAQTFEQVGVSITKADGSLKSSSDVLKELSDRFAAMPDGAEKTALAMELMGRSGASMIPLLNGGSEALSKLMAEADTFGQVFSAEMGASAEQFNDNMTRLQGAMGNVAAQIAQKLLPHMAAFSEWLVANAPKIADFVVGMVEFGIAAVKLGQDVVAAFDALDQGIRAAGERMRGYVASLAAVFVELKDQAVAAIQAMVEGIQTWLVGRLTAVWDAAMGKVQQYIDKVKGAYNAIVGHSIIPDMVTEVESWMNRLGNSFGNSIAGLIDGTMSWKEALASVLQELVNIFARSQGLGSGGGKGGFLGGLLDGILGGLPGFATGGSFKVGGMGGVDSQLVAFRATPGETVNIHQPGNDNMQGASIRNVVEVEPSPLFITTVRQENMATEARVLQKIPGHLSNLQARYG